MKVNGKRLVLIEWEDSFGVSPSWEGLDDVEEPEAAICYSVGWLIVDGDKRKVVVPHVHEANESIGAVFSGCGDMTIPTSAVRRLVDLKAAKR